MHKGYGSHSVSEHVCVSVTVLPATYLTYTSKMRRHRVPCRLLKIYMYCVNFAENVLI